MLRLRKKQVREWGPESVALLIISHQQTLAEVLEEVRLLRRELVSWRPPFTDSNVISLEERRP